ncbi:hypothetical protein [Actinomadura miaoliensis]|uniref:Uncharacterized protein n=1 Tax=Actinomadura miaoliensis TaxID=430685 RepID=A0ABP7VCZ5_9ACTN
MDTDQERPFPPSATGTGPIGVHDTSGIQVRLRPRGTDRRRRGRRRSGRRAGVLAACAMAVAAVLIGAGVLLMPGLRDGNPRAGNPRDGGGATPEVSRTVAARLRAGSPVDVGTADGSRYRLQAVTGGLGDGAVTTQQSSQPPHKSFPYIDYILSNPTGDRVLLDFPGDVFVRRNLVAARDRGRCVWQAGVPETMCTPPTRSEVVRTLSGGALIVGDGGDRYMPPRSSYLVRATVEVPVDRRLRRGDLRLYVWKQLYMADRPAREAPFPARPRR